MLQHTIESKIGGYGLDIKCAQDKGEKQILDEIGELMLYDSQQAYELAHAYSIPIYLLEE